MKCGECGTPMIINAWYGWVWECFRCGHTGRLATDEEIKDQEDEVEKLKVMNAKHFKTNNVRRV